MPRLRLLHSTFGLVLVAILSSCAWSERTAPVPEDFSRRWIRGIPCHLPCWEGLVPGQTTLHEAEQILRSTPYVRASSLERYTASNPVSIHLSWRYSDGRSSGSAIFGGNPPSENSILVELSPNFGESFTVPLREIIDAFGNPTHAQFIEASGGDFIFPMKPVYDVSVLYESNGLRLVGSYQHPAPKIDLDLLFNEIIITDPLSGWYRSTVDSYKRWNNGAGFDYYCINYDTPDWTCMYK